MAGGKVWSRIPQMLKNNPMKVHLLPALQGPLEECGMSREVADWTVSNLDLVAPQTHPLINQLIDDGR